MRVPSDNPLRTTADTDVPRNKKGQLRREVGRANTEEAVLETFPREQLLVVCPWPPWFASPGNVIFRLGDLTGVAHDDDPVFRRTFEESCADLPQADVMIWCDETAIIRAQWCGSGAVIHWTGEQDHESIATAAGHHGSPHHTEIIAVLRAMEAVSCEKFRFNY